MDDEIAEYEDLIDEVATKVDFDISTIVDFVPVGYMRLWNIFIQEEKYRTFHQEEYQTFHFFNESAHSPEPTLLPLDFGIVGFAMLGE